MVLVPIDVNHIANKTNITRVVDDVIKLPLYSIRASFVALTYLYNEETNQYNNPTGNAIASKNSVVTIRYPIFHLLRIKQE